MEKIKIRFSPNGDTRTAEKRHIIFEEFSKANTLHRLDVSSVMFAISELIRKCGIAHDWTKKSEEEKFFKDFTEAREEGKNFIELGWYDYHINTERHHINNRCPDDVNLIDVIEMIVDCCCAGMARRGEVSDISISDQDLRKAFNNTIELVKNMIELEK